MIPSESGFGWFYRPAEPDHVIALCAGHKYLAGRGWKPGEGSLAPLPLAHLCCVCMGTASIKRMRGAPLKPPNVLPQPTEPLPKLNLKRGTSAEYCRRCGLLRSQCDCWDPVNQEM